VASTHHPGHDGFWRAPPAPAGTRRVHTYNQYASTYRAPAGTSVAAASDPLCPA